MRAYRVRKLGLGCALIMCSAGAAVGQTAGAVANDNQEQPTPYGAHPFQVLAMAGNIVGLTRRDPIPDVDFDLIWNDNPTLCADFETIIAEGYSRLALSTEVVDLGSGYHTIPWAPDLRLQHSRLFLEPGEAITESHLHRADWRARIEGISFEYSVFMLSDNYRGTLASCIGDRETCDPLMDAIPWHLDIAELAMGARRDAELKLLGPRFSYPENADPTVRNDLPNTFFLQFLNVVQSETGTFFVSFWPKGYNTGFALPNTHGIMIWDITERQMDNYAACWFSASGMGIHTPQTQD